MSSARCFPLDVSTKLDISRSQGRNQNLPPAFHLIHLAPIQFAMTDLIPKKSTPQNLNRLYIVSLSTIAALAIAGQFLIQRQLSRQAMDIAVVNAAQERKQLCERLLKTTLASKVAIGEERSVARQELETLVQDWENSRQTLQQQLQKNLSPTELAEIDPIFARLKPLGEEILSMATSSLTPRSRTSIPKLIKTGTEFNREIDNVIRWYSDKVEDGVARLRALEFGLLGLTLGTLLLEGLLVFRPAIAKLKETLQALDQSLHKLTLEQEKSEKLLLNILPEPIADRLKSSPQTIADSFTEATVLFADIVGFTELSGRLPPQELVQCLNTIFSCFDQLAEKYSLEKIKTIGDAYMIVGGLPNPRPDHAVAIAHMALEMQTELQRINRSMGEKFDIRIGINSGPVVAGVIGIKKFIYDLWGDTVNIASRMESHGQAGAIHISETTYQLLEDQFDCQPRGRIQIKGKGEMMTYWLKELQPSGIKR